MSNCHLVVQICPNFNYSFVSFDYFVHFREEVHDHQVKWHCKRNFVCKMIANANTGVLEPCLCRVSVRKVGVVTLCNCYTSKVLWQSIIYMYRYICQRMITVSYFILILFFISSHCNFLTSHGLHQKWVKFLTNVFLWFHFSWNWKGLGCQITSAESLIFQYFPIYSRQINHQQWTRMFFVNCQIGRSVRFVRWKIEAKCLISTERLLTE